MEMPEPRVLFICNQPFSTKGNEKTYLSLFKDFKNEEVAQLYFNNTFSDSTLFTNYFRVTDFDILLNKLTFGFVKIRGTVDSSVAEDLAVNRNVKSVGISIFLKKVIRNFIHSLFNITSSKSFTLWMEDFKPTVIFFIGGNYDFAYRLLKQISSKYNLPYYIYFTDDYFIHNNGNSRLEKIFHKRFKEKNTNIVKKSEELFVISPKMKIEYHDFFDRNCTILINAVDNSLPNPIVHTYGKTIIFRYFGWLHSDRLSSLTYLAECLLHINLISEFTCKLEIYTLTLREEIKLDESFNNIIQIKEPISGKDYEDKLRSSDFLVHSESFNPVYAKSTRLSISTKIPEYLISNRCVVALGPPFLASIAIFKDFELGISITEKDSVIKYANEILKVINHDHLYEEYCIRSKEFYKKEFDAKEMRRKLKEKLGRFNFRHH